jgi:hypothetical protein
VTTSQVCWSARLASSASMAAMCARIGVCAGEPGLARARAACSSRLVRSSSDAVSALTSCTRPGSGICQLLAVVLPGYHPVEGGLQVGPRWRDGVLLVEERDSSFQLSAVVAELEGGQSVHRAWSCYVFWGRVRDGSDPKVTGCATGAVTSDSVDVYDPPEHLVGTLELRSSARCGTSWGRFVPTSALRTQPALTLEIDVDRPADGTAAKFHVAYDGLPAYGNMLISRHECVYAQLTLNRRGQSTLPPIQTSCRKSPGS